MAPVICPICDHDSRQHDETGRCGQTSCSCVVDPRDAFRSQKPEGLLTPFARRLESFVAEGLRVAGKTPATDVIVTSWAFFFVAAFVAAFRAEYSTLPWFRAHDHGLFVLEVCLIILGLPGVFMGELDRPGEKLPAVAIRAAKLWGCIVLVLVAMIGVVMLVRPP
jgi:hypothetical protein